MSMQIISAMIIGGLAGVLIGAVAGMCIMGVMFYSSTHGRDAEIE